jgi:ATP-dependent Lhr-like helicase
MGPGLGFTMCRRIRDLLATDGERKWWSQRARDGMTAIRADYPWLSTDGTVIVTEASGEVTWWTFAGKGVNATLASTLQARIEGKVGHDNFAVKVEAGVTPGDLDGLIADIRNQPAAELRPAIDPAAVATLKFADCVPPALAERMLQVRLRDADGTAAVLAEPTRIVVGG